VEKLANTKKMQKSFSGIRNSTNLVKEALLSSINKTFNISPP
jgi:arginyl-tRNA synthetase